MLNWDENYFFLIIFKHFSAFLQTPKKFILNNSIPAFHQNAGMSIIKIMDIPAFRETPVCLNIILFSASRVSAFVGILRRL